jgi:hypothetical protein
MRRAEETEATDVFVQRFLALLHGRRRHQEGLLGNYSSETVRDDDDGPISGTSISTSRDFTEESRCVIAQGPLADTVEEPSHISIIAKCEYAGRRQILGQKVGRPVDAILQPCVERVSPQPMDEDDIDSGIWWRRGPKDRVSGHRGIPSQA